MWLLGRYLRRITLGWGPEGLAQHVLRTDAALRSVRDGVLLVDRRGALALYNDQAAKLLGLPPRQGPRAGPPPPALDDLGLPESLVDLLGSGRAAHDETHLTDNRVLTVSQEPAFPGGSRGRSRSLPLGTVTTIRDPLESLGAVAAPVIGALLAGKMAEAREADVQLAMTTVGGITETGMPVQDLVAPLGNLLDDAIAAASAGEPPRRVTVNIRADAADSAVILEVSGGPGGTTRTVTVPGPETGNG
jgi:sensor histidine kinase regulating citrate/malate metabolism